MLPQDAARVGCELGNCEAEIKRTAPRSRVTDDLIRLKFLMRRMLSQKWSNIQSGFLRSPISEISNFRSQIPKQNQNSSWRMPTGLSCQRLLRRQGVHERTAGKQTLGFHRRPHTLK